MRARRKGLGLVPVMDRTRLIRPADLLLFATVRNERARLPWFLAYYRRLGIDHFLFVDNASDDGTGDWLAAQPDVSLWRTSASYRDANFGMDWMNRLLARHGHGHWCLTVDADEFLVYPFCDSRPLRALTDWLDGGGRRVLPAMLLDMYPDGPLGAATCAEGRDPFEDAAWFDAGNYVFHPADRYLNLWIQGGPRARTFFAGAPEQAPALNKIPLVRWRRSYAYVSSTHMLLPRGLNRAFDEGGGEAISGCLLHAKFAVAPEPSTLHREHYAGGREHLAHLEAARGGTVLRTEWSERYRDWRQLDALGLLSTGSWA